MTAALTVAPANLDVLLRHYFEAASDTCRRVTRAQTRAGVESALHHGGTAFSSGSDGESGLLFSSPNAWETSHFGCRVVQLIVLPSVGEREGRGAQASALLEHWSAARGHEEQEYAVARIASDDAPLAGALEDAGFRLLVPMVTLDLALDGQAGAARSVSTAIGPVVSAEVEALGEIARTAFSFGRFTVEPALAPHVPGAMHAEWARNCGKGAMADATLVARDRNAVIGFIALRYREYEGVPTGEINLIAVSAAARGSGVGQALVAAGLEWAKGRGARCMIVRTELPNAASIRMYERRGFRMGEGSLYYRRWRFAPVAPYGALR